MIRVLGASGRVEALLALVYVALVWSILPHQADWLTVSSGVIMAWAMIIAPGSPLLSSIFLVAVVVSLFAVGTESALMVGLLAFLLIEVLFSLSAWWPAGIACVAVFLWGLVGQQFEPWSVSKSIVPLITTLGISLALSTGLLRLHLENAQGRRKAELKSAQLKERLAIARDLHAGSVSHLTRVLILAKDSNPHIEREAKDALLTLRSLLRSLHEDEWSCHPCNLVSEIRQGIAVGRGAGKSIESSGVKGAVMVDSRIGVIARELITNALKYGQRIRIELESDTNSGILLVANEGAPEGDLHELYGSGYGLEDIHGLAMAVDARFTVLRQQTGVSTLLEFPLKVGEKQL